MSALVPVNTRQAIPYAQDLNGWTQDGGPGFPYDTNLSFLPLIKFWESRIENEQSPEFFLAREIVSRVENIPVLKEPIIDISLLENYQEEIELLMLAIYPPAIKNDIMELRVSHLVRIGSIVLHYIRKLYKERIRKSL